MVKRNVLMAKPTMHSTRSIVVFAVPAITLTCASYMVLNLQAALISSLFGLAMLAIAISDVRSFIVPDILSLPAIPAGLLATSLLAEGEQPHLAALHHLGAALGGMLIFMVIKQAYAAVRKHEGIGLGDVKLATVGGAWTGFTGLAPILLLACVLAISMVILANARDLRSIKPTTPVPFGACLAPSIWLIWFAQTSGLDFVGPF